MAGSGGSLQSVDAFGGNPASAAVNTFSDIIYFIKKFYRFYTYIRFAKTMLQSMCHCSTARHKKSIPINSEEMVFK
jgi:hypothetical protein